MKEDRRQRPRLLREWTGGETVRWGAGRRGEALADIFISYTSNDRQWAFWIADELKAFGTCPCPRWELPGAATLFTPGRSAATCRRPRALRGLGRPSEGPRSALERHAALWQAAAQRPGFVLLVVVKPAGCLRSATIFTAASCSASPSMRHASVWATFWQRRRRPRPAAFRGEWSPSPMFPSTRPTTSWAATRHRRRSPSPGVARDTGRGNGALHGCAASARPRSPPPMPEHHRGDHRATWWILAETDSHDRSDSWHWGCGSTGSSATRRRSPSSLWSSSGCATRATASADLGQRPDARRLMPWLPRGGAARVLITSNAHDWRSVAEPVEILVWAMAVGADYLIARTGRPAERRDGRKPRRDLGGLPLGTSRRPPTASGLASVWPSTNGASPPNRCGCRTIDDTRRANTTTACRWRNPSGLPSRRPGGHPAAEPLIMHLALLAPEAIPPFLLEEARALHRAAGRAPRRRRTGRGHRRPPRLRAHRPRDDRRRA